MKKILLILISILFLSGCEKSVNIEKYDMFYMDTYIEIKLYDISGNEADRVFKELDNMYKEYNELADRYNAYDGVVNVYYLNNNLKVNEEIEIDSKLAEIIEYSIDAYNKTDRYFNIALGNVIDVWKEYREKKDGVPATYELMNCGSIDISDIKLNGSKYKRTGDVKIDLGGIAKGYVTELAGEYLESKGYTKYLINAGGNVKVGERYQKDKYTVGLEEPFNVSNVYKRIHVENTSIVTSGSYQRYYKYNDVIYNHIINPKTLFPENYTKSVTVITEDSALGEILSKYLFLIPIEEGIEYVNSLPDVEAVWYSDQIYYSEDFDMYE